MYNLYTGPKALNFPNADKPGSYRLVSRIAANTFNPGDTLKLEQFITGYGTGSGFKIFCNISDNLFDESQSRLVSDLTQTLTNPPMLQWGGREIPISNGGYTFTLSSRGHPPWGSPAEIFDIKENHNYIATERTIKNAPFLYILKLKKNVKPGMNYLLYNMTFFNGNEWVCQEEKIPFKINNTFERYNKILSALAAAALLVTIIHNGLAPTIETIHEWGKAIVASHQR